MSGVTNLHNYSLRDLYEDLQEIAEGRREAKERETDIQAEIARRAKDEGLDPLATAGKMYGSSTVPWSGGLKLAVEKKLDVKYDQDMLLAWAAAQPWERVNHFLKVKVEVRESVFKALEADSAERRAFVAARTEKVGETKYTLIDSAATA